MHFAFLFVSPLRFRKEERLDERKSISKKSNRRTQTKV